LQELGDVWLPVIFFFVFSWSSPFFVSSKQKITESSAINDARQQMTDQK
jgi:hypothetical protein